MDLYNGAHRQGIANEQHTAEQLCVKFVVHENWKALPDAAFQSIGGRDKAKAARRAHVEARRQRGGWDPSLPSEGTTPAKAARAASLATEGSPENGGANGAAAGVKRKASDEPDVPAKAARADGDVTPLSAAAAAAAVAATPLAVERVD